MSISREHKLLDTWKTGEYLFSKHRGEIDYLKAVRLSDSQVFIVQNDIVQDEMETDAGLDWALEQKIALGYFPIIQLTKEEIAEEYSRVHFCGKPRRVEFNRSGVSYFNEAEAALNKGNAETSAVYQLNCFAALVFAGFKGYEKLYNMPTDLTIKQVVYEIGLVNKPAIEKIQGIFRNTIESDPDLAGCYGFQPF